MVNIISGFAVWITIMTIPGTFLLLSKLYHQVVCYFRCGGIVKRNEKWLHGGKIIECVKQYTYLGLFFTTTLSWSLAKKVLAA